MISPTSIYDKLLQLPLFQGHSREDLTAILTKIKVDFRTFRKGQRIAMQDDPCQNIIFLLEGEVTTMRTSQHNELTFIEHFAAPNAFGVDTIFGIRQNFSHSIVADSEVRTLMVAKQNIINSLFTYDVFRFNLLNMLSTRIQRSNRMLWASDNEDVVQRFIMLCKKNFVYHGGPKQVDGGMVALAQMLNLTRITISNMLNNLEQRNLIEMGRKKIFIPHFERLIKEA